MLTLDVLSVSWVTNFRDISSCFDFDNLIFFRLNPCNYLIPWRDLCHLIKSIILICITEAWSISWASSSELIPQVCRWTLFLNPLTNITLRDLFDDRSTICLLHSYLSWVKSSNKQIGYDICLSISPYLFVRQ